MTRTNKAATMWWQLDIATNTFHVVIIISRDVLVQNSTTAFTQLNPHPGGKFYILSGFTLIFDIPDLGISMDFLVS
ncbi:hypothetical protein T06_11333 [Trichinella sp. T6]|nr:hypothetical protein T06_11333 [Trichinella sp. T6]